MKKKKCQKCLLVNIIENIKNLAKLFCIVIEYHKLGIIAKCKKKWKTCHLPFKCDAPYIYFFVFNFIFYSFLATTLAEPWLKNT